jgi:hypothetical protein
LARPREGWHRDSSHGSLFCWKKTLQKLFIGYSGVFLRETHALPSLLRKMGYECWRCQHRAGLGKALSDLDMKSVTCSLWHFTIRERPCVHSPQVFFSGQDDLQGPSSPELLIHAQRLLPSVPVLQWLEMNASGSPPHVTSPLHWGPHGALQLATPCSQFPHCV